MKEIVNILLLGSGGREAALAWKISASPRLGRLYVAPGNASGFGEKAELDPMDFDAVREFVESHSVDMIVVGPEAPLVAGIADAFEGSDVKVIGPSAAGARLEGSKEFAKEFMFRNLIPTARFMTVTQDTLNEGVDFLESLEPPYVLKADGLAGGKGVIITSSLPDAKDTLAEMLDGKFGDASSTVVIEEFLQGIECSVFMAVDGEDFVFLPVAKDYKRIGEGDTGPNTGGMGAVTPLPFADEEFMDKVRKRIAEPTVRGLREEGMPYSGFIFLGLMNCGGEPYVIEYNCRLGDPETEVVIPMIESDIIDLLEGIADTTLAIKKVETRSGAAATVILASEGYPGPCRKGCPISAGDTGDAILFYAGAKPGADGNPVTSGGRVMAVTAFGEDLAQAVEKAMSAAENISFEGKYFRRDIGRDILER